MKLPKDRKLNPYLINQYKQQEERIRNCGIYASLNHITLIYHKEGTYFTTKPKRL